MNTTAVLDYSHYHYDFPRAFGETTADSLQVGFGTALISGDGF